MSHQMGEGQARSMLTPFGVESYICDNNVTCSPPLLELFYDSRAFPGIFLYF